MRTTISEITTTSSGPFGTEARVSGRQRRWRPTLSDASDREACDATLRQLRFYLRSKAIESQRVEDALTLGSLLGYTNFSNNDGLLEDEELEQLLFRRFRSELTPGADVAESGSGHVHVLHVISEAYENGGHTRLLANLVEGARGLGLGSQLVAITREAPESFIATIHDLGAETRRLGGTLSERARTLIRLGRSADAIVLHIHPDDLPAALAARALRDQGKCVLFLNHADHVFTFGPGAAETVLEISAFGWYATQLRRHANAQHYLGIPVVGSVWATDASPTDIHGPIVAIGSGYKFEPDKRLDFPDFLVKLLDRVPNDAELIGPSGDEPWWVEVKSKHPKRVSFTGPLSFEETQRRLGGASCYVDSFPVGGGTAFTQALMTGRAVFSPFGGERGGYSLADGLAAPGVAEMTNDIVEFLRSGCEPKCLAEIRRRILSEFSATAVAGRFQHALSGTCEPPPEDILESGYNLDLHVEMWRDRAVVTVPRRRDWAPLPLLGRLSVLRDLAIGRVSGYSRRQRWLLAWWLLAPGGA
jgi:hypothetical protein